ncbi:MAG: mechanosensitive ion channel family protein [Anaerolineaceae bacterium]|jgi:small-conductance mechanosensitive channel|nr:mechanosensitive ion channel family protein [Anaerolineaceae bacterium]
MTDFEIWGNSIFSWLSALATFIGLYLLLTILVKLVKSRLTTIYKKNDLVTFTYILSILNNTKKLFLLILSFYIASVWLVITEKPTLYINTLFMIAFWIQVGIWANHTIINFINHRNRFASNGDDKTTMNALKTILRIVLWSIVLILVIDNIPGVEITALITSLGIGGIAIGLAVQNILSDLFASLSITLDKPFVINDFIQVDDYVGTVEKIGLKSTRIRSLSGEQLVFSNSDLLNSRIQNFKRLERRRKVLNLGVLYQTTPEQLRKIPDLIKNIFSKINQVTLDRIHLSEFGDFSINFELVYWVESSDYVLHMDLKQDILLAIFDQFIENEIEFAYPTQSIFIEDNGKPIPLA